MACGEVTAPPQSPHRVLPPPVDHNTGAVGWNRPPIDVDQQPLPPDDYPLNKLAEAAAFRQQQFEMDKEVEKRKEVASSEQEESHRQAGAGNPDAEHVRRTAEEEYHEQIERGERKSCGEEL